MGGFEEHTCSQENPVFLHDGKIFSREMCTGDVTFITVSYPTSGEKTFIATSPQGNSCTEIPQKKNERVDYPGRSVLYSRQFRPFEPDNQHKKTQPPLGEL